MAWRSLWGVGGRAGAWVGRACRAENRGSVASKSIVSGYPSGRFRFAPGRDYRAFSGRFFFFFCASAKHSCCMRAANALQRALGDARPPPLCRRLNGSAGLPLRYCTHTSYASLVMPMFHFSLSVHASRLWEPNEVPSDSIDCPNFSQVMCLCPCVYVNDRYERDK